MERSRTSGVAWLALIVAVLALFIGWMAYNRTGDDLEDRIQNQIERGVDATPEAIDEAEQAIDEGPDGVDEDDTEVPQNQTQ